MKTEDWRRKGGKKMKPRHVELEDRKKMGAYGATLADAKNTDWSHLPREGDKEKCYDKTVLDKVQKHMGWDLPPAGAFLFDELRQHRERAKTALQPPKKRARVVVEDPLVAKCNAAASKVSVDAATGETTIQNVTVVAKACRAIGLKLPAGGPGPSDLVEALKRVAWLKTEQAPSLGDLFKKVAAMPEAERRSLVERTKVAERARLGFASSIERLAPTRAAPAPTRAAPLAPAKRAELATAKPAPLGPRDLNTDALVVATANPTTFEGFIAAAEYAIKSNDGENVFEGTQSRACKVLVVSAKEWRTFASRTEAEKALRLKIGDLKAVIDGNVERIRTAIRGKYEAHNVGLPINREVAFVQVLRGLGVRLDEHKLRTDLVGYAFQVSQYIAFGAIGQSRPEGWGGVLERLKTLEKKDWLKLAVETAKGEAERVRQLHASTLTGAGRDALNELRQHAAVESRRLDEEAYQELLLLGHDLEGELQRAFATDVTVLYVPHYVLDDGQPVYVMYKGKSVELKAGPWEYRFAFGDGGLGIGSAGGASNPYGPRGTLVATIKRPVAGDAAYLSRAAACGDRKLLHRGDGGGCAVTLTPRKPAWDVVRRHSFCSIKQMRKLGFRLVRDAPALTADGATIEGFGTSHFTFHLTEGGSDMMEALQEEFGRFRGDLLRVTRRDKRLAEGVSASLRRDKSGGIRTPPQVVSFMLTIPCRASGATARTVRALEHLQNAGYPLMAELNHRCILSSVAFEFLAYRDPAVGGKWHFDKCVDFLLSALQMKSVTMKEDANLKGSKQHFTLAECRESEREDDDSRGLLDATL